MVGATCRKRAVILGLTIAVMTITGIVLQDHAGRHRAAIARPTSPPRPIPTTRPSGYRPACEAARRVRGGVSVPVASFWPAATAMAPSGCGTWEWPDLRFGTPGRLRPAGQRVRGGVQSRRASCWPARMRTGRCGCGMRLPGGSSGSRCRPHRPACSGWRSVPTAGSWPARMRTGRCGCGIRHRAAVGSPPAGPARPVRGGVQSRRQAAGQR